MTSSADLLVLGAGPAGLAAAWRASRRGLAVTVLERAPAVGGLAGSFEVAGVRVDHGSHRLHPATPPTILADLRGLLGDDLQTRRRSGRLRLAGRWVDFPLRAGELAGTLPAPLLARVAAEAVAQPLRRARTDSYAATLRRGLGPTLYEALYAPYAEKLWGLPGDRISAEQARRRVTADTPWKLASRVLRIRRNRGQGRVFYYPRRGYGQISEALADTAVAAGARIALGTAVEEVHPGPESVRVVAAGEEFHAGQVFSTLPLPALAAMTNPGPPAAAVEAARQLRFRAMVLVYLVCRDGRWTTYDAHYLPGPETPVTRISEPANYRDSADDPDDRSVLCLEIPCDVGDEVWRADDATLRELADEALAITGLPPVRAVEVAVRRLPRVYPVYEVGFERRLDDLDRWAASLPRITTFGRLGLFAHDNTHHAMVMAYDAVDALRPDGLDRTAWAAARSRFAAHVVED
ncbi:MAG: FAD-dependent oxidoreductase [Streptosporangiales bacterium]|nr:FAD-dependent oxidoreductase [Streptosporangiales bacterium]